MCGLTCCLLGRYGLNGQAEPKSAAGGDLRGSPCQAELLTQTRDMGVDHVRAWIEMHVPDFIVKLAPRHDLAAVQHQVLEQLELHRREVDVARGTRHSTRQAV